MHYYDVHGRRFFPVTHARPKERRSSRCVAEAAGDRARREFARAVHLLFRRSAGTDSKANKRLIDYAHTHCSTTDRGTYFRRGKTNQSYTAIYVQVHRGAVFSKRVYIGGWENRRHRRRVFVKTFFFSRRRDMTVFGPRAVILLISYTHE